MDIISMQIANKILKRINTDYNGFLQMAVATQGQTAVIVTKEYSVGANTLSVYVDGILAYLTEDYLETDANTITFVKPLEAGSIVLFKTNVAGIPKYVTANPIYDDTAVKGLITANASSISTVDGKVTVANTDITNIKGDIVTAKSDIASAKTKIDNIIALLDDDADGEIIDIFANLKTQWETADGDLQTLLGDKVSSELFNTLNSEIVEAREIYGTLKERLTALVDAIVLNDTSITSLTEGATAQGLLITDITGDVSAIGDSLALLIESVGVITGKITTMESDISDIKDTLAIPKPNFLFLTDTVTGFEYEIRMTNGVLKSDLIKILTAALITRAGNGNIYAGDVISFTATSQYQDVSDATVDSTFSYSVNDETKAIINSVSGQLTALSLGVVTVKVTATIGVTSVEGTTTISIVVNEVEKVQLAKTNLDLGDTSAIITDIILPATQNEANVTWASDTESVVSSTGIVVRPLVGTADATVILTATITYGVATDTKAFTLTVLQETV